MTSEERRVMRETIRFTRHSSGSRPSHISGHRGSLRHDAVAGDAGEGADDAGGADAGVAADEGEGADRRVRPHADAGLDVSVDRAFDGHAGLDDLALDTFLHDGVDLCELVARV